MATYSVNELAVEHAEGLIDRRQYMLDSGCVHRSALIACCYRAMEWRHRAVADAAYELLKLLDDTAR